jgi:hypothetical protein
MTIDDKVIRQLPDYLFDDCRRIAMLYEQKLIDVVIKFTEIEKHQRDLKRDDRYTTIKTMTTNYFKANQIHRETEEI